MPRPSRVECSAQALMHNLSVVRTYAPHARVVAMVKANAYGCGVSQIVPQLEGHVDALGVASLEEAMDILRLGARTPCVLFEGVFSKDEYPVAAQYGMQVVIHSMTQLHWLLSEPLPSSLTVWLKVNTGMNRLGVPYENAAEALHALAKCPWVKKPLGLMTHLACADEPHHSHCALQLKRFKDITCDNALPIQRSVANSAAILSDAATHYDVVRPGIMLYGVSPFEHQTAQALNLKPVMRFFSEIMTVQHCAKGDLVGYGGCFKVKRQSRIAVVAAGYGDGYPRRIAQKTPVYINGYLAPIVGRVSMDMLTVDVTDIPEAHLAGNVELWGEHLPVETIARASNTIGYELLCQVTKRPIRNG